jgi:U3 small nucleolar RNA-associated protein 25
VDYATLNDVASDDDEQQATARPYMALMQKFQDSSASSAPSAKRRKITHAEPSSRSPSPAQEESEEEEEGESDPKREDIDEVDEEEEEGEDQTGGVQDDANDSDDEIDAADPFDAHFANPDQQISAPAVTAAKKGDWTTSRAMIQPWRAVVVSPDTNSTDPIPQPISGLGGLKLKQKLRETAKEKMSNLDAAQKAFAPLLFGYKDVLHCDRSVDNSHKMRQTVCLHALNHIFK